MHKIKWNAIESGAHVSAFDAVCEFVCMTLVLVILSHKLFVTKNCNKTFGGDAISVFILLVDRIFLATL